MIDQICPFYSSAPFIFCLPLTPARCGGLTGIPSAPLHAGLDLLLSFCSSQPRHEITWEPTTVLCKSWARQLVYILHIRSR